MVTAVRPANTSSGSWDAFADVDVFVDEVLAELDAMTKGGALQRRLLDRLRRDCGDSPERSAVVIDSRSCSSASAAADICGDHRSG
jgi:hypothetical protein